MNIHQEVDALMASIAPLDTPTSAPLSMLDEAIKAVQEYHAAQGVTTPWKVYDVTRYSAAEDGDLFVVNMVHILTTLCTECGQLHSKAALHHHLVSRSTATGLYSIIAADEWQGTDRVPLDQSVFPEQAQQQDEEGQSKHDE